MLRSFINQHKRLIASLASAFALAYAGHNNVRPNQFALKESFQHVTGGVKPSGIYLHVPLAQYTHSYQQGVQVIGFNAGSCRFVTLCDSSADQNAMHAKLRLSYRIEQDAEKLALHRWSMDGWVFEDGYWLITRFMNDSANAVLGRRNLHETMSDPDRFLREFSADFESRMQQNSVPVKVERLELTGFGTGIFTPVRSVAYSTLEH